MRSTIFPNIIKVRADPDLRAGLLKAAEEQRTTVSEVVRRELRSALAGRSPGRFEKPPERRFWQALSHWNYWT